MLKHMSLVINFSWGLFWPFLFWKEFLLTVVLSGHLYDLMEWIKNSFFKSSLNSPYYDLDFLFFNRLLWSLGVESWKYSSIVYSDVNHASTNIWMRNFLPFRERLMILMKRTKCVADEDESAEYDMNQGRTAPSRSPPQNKNSPPPANLFASFVSLHTFWFIVLPSSARRWYTHLHSTSGNFTISARNHRPSALMTLLRMRTCFAARELICIISRCDTWNLSFRVKCWSGASINAWHGPERTARRRSLLKSAATSNFHHRATVDSATRALRGLDECLFSRSRSRD